MPLLAAGCNMPTQQADNTKLLYEFSTIEKPELAPDTLYQT